MPPHKLANITKKRKGLMLFGENFVAVSLKLKNIEI